MSPSPKIDKKKKAVLPRRTEEAIHDILAAFKIKLDQELTAKFTKRMEEELHSAMSAVGGAIGKAVKNYDLQVVSFFSYFFKRIFYPFVIGVAWKKNFPFGGRAIDNGVFGKKILEGLYFFF